MVGLGFGKGLQGFRVGLVRICWYASGKDLVWRGCGIGFGTHFARIWYAFVYGFGR